MQAGGASALREKWKATLSLALAVTTVAVLNSISYVCKKKGTGGIECYTAACGCKRVAGAARCKSGALQEWHVASAARCKSSALQKRHVARAARCKGSALMLGATLTFPSLLASRLGAKLTFPSLLASRLGATLTFFPMLTSRLGATLTFFSCALRSSRSYTNCSADHGRDASSASVLARVCG